MLSKWDTWPARSLNGDIRYAYYCGLFAAQRDNNMLNARYADDLEERQRWVDRARYENLQLVDYLRRLRERGQR